MKNKLKGNKEMKERYFRIGMYLLTFTIIYILLITTMAPKEYDLKQGEIATVTIKAPRDTVDEMATRAKQLEAASKVDKQFTQKTDVEATVKDKVDSILSQILVISSSNKKEQDKVNEILEIPNCSITKADAQTLVNLSSTQLNKLKSYINEILTVVYANNVQDGNVESLNTAYATTNDRISVLNLDENIQDALKNLIIPNIEPNFFYDKQKTEAERKEAEKQVAPVEIKKNQTIVTDGEPVTANQIQILKSLGLLDQSGGTGLFILYAVLAIFTALILFIQHFYMYKNHKKEFKNTKILIMINLINVMSLIIARLFTEISPFVIPLACAPILITLLVDYRMSLVVCSINVLFIAAVVNFNPQIIMLGILSAIIGATSLRRMQQRNDIFYSSIFLIVMSGILTFSTGVLLSNNMSEILFISMAASGGVVLSAILAIGILPFFESTFDIVTNLKLLELTNSNSPLLKKLLMEAPGTYHHSMLVANLSEMAAEDINANPIIARVGAYYHDVGKTKRPYFFRENQIGRENPHDKINANLSTLIIISHVKDGLELANEYKMPQIIKDMIVQHHGTTLVKYFYYTMKNNAENPEEIKEEDFRYPGPIPTSKEAGIIMLADGVEAAVRSISEPTKGKIEEMVNNIIKDKLYSGQLDDCDLTLKDLEKIRKSFLKALNGIYHQRIEYPTDKTKV